MTIPIFREFMYPILEILRNGEVYTISDIYEQIINVFRFTEEDLNETTKGGTTTKVKDRITWSLSYLNHSPLILKVSWGKYKITDEGLAVLNDENITNVDEEFLMKYPEFRKFKNPGKKSDGNMGDPDTLETNYWLYSPGEGANKWNKYFKNNVMGIGFSDIGDLSQYESKNDIREKVLEITNDNNKHTNDILALWQFANEVKEGDVIYAKRGMSEIIGRGIVTGNYYYDEEFDKDHKHMLKVNWKTKGNWKYDGKLPMKTLTDITIYTEMLNNIQNFFDDDPTGGEEIIEYPPYPEEDFLKEVFLDEEEYNTLVNLLLNKKNIIIQGAPGVGKTYVSKRLAYSIMGVKDKEKVELVQFHQSYSYEDFIMGYRPSNDGFELEKGIFYDFCKKAEIDEDNMYFFIIDEINRGNLSKIFGELFMLIEGDKRGYPVKLLYNKESFSIPNNIYIIGLMNTADRSLAMLDYALRRRFRFYDLKPAFDTHDFKKYMGELDSIKFNEMVNLIKDLNDEISKDEVLGEGFQIGHSYFSNLTKENVDNELNNIVEYEIIPLLKEYWFDEKDNVNKWTNRLRNVIL